MYRNRTLGKRKYRPFINQGYANRPFKVARTGRRRGRTNALLKYRQNLRSGGYLGIEKKFADHNVILQPLTHNDIPAARVDPAANCLCAISQGDGESQRDGKRVTLKTLVLHYKIKCLNTVLENVNVRIVLVKDTQTNAAVFNPNQVFLPTTSPDSSILAFRNLQYTSRFQVMYDKVHKIRNQIFYNGAIDRSNEDQLIVRKVFDLKNTIVNYTAATADVNVIMDNSYHLLAITDYPNIVLSYETRVRFVG